jgi:hypothetical protein
MRSAFGFVGILMVLGIGYYIYSARIRSGPDNELLPRQTNLIAVKQDLLALAQAERLYLAANGSYATLEQLRRSGVVGALPKGGRGGYEYSIEADGARHFVITASPMDSSRSDLPTFSIDESMQVSS